MFLAFIAGAVGGIFGSFGLDFVKRFLKKPEVEATIERGLPVPKIAVPKGKKRAPRIITDLMEYQKEIELEGHNRG